MLCDVRSKPATAKLSQKSWQSTTMQEGRRGSREHTRHRPERLAERREHPVGVGVGAPDLGGDVDLVAGGDDPRAHGLGDGLPDGRLGGVVRGGVEVAVAQPYGAEHRGADGVRPGALHRRAQADARQPARGSAGGAHGVNPQPSLSLKGVPPSLTPLASRRAWTRFECRHHPLNCVAVSDTCYRHGICIYTHITYHPLPPCALCNSEPCMSLYRSISLQKCRWGTSLDVVLKKRA